MSEEFKELKKQLLSGKKNGYDMVSFPPLICGHNKTGDVKAPGYLNLRLQNNI